MQTGLSTCVSLLTLCFTVVQAMKGFPTTYDGFNWFLIFDTPILNSIIAGEPDIDATPYDLVWGASDYILPMYRRTNPNIVLAYYIPWARDNDGTHDLAYWRSFHPEWVLYKCDKVTPATQFNDPHIPLDISNPDVIDWQIQRYTAIVAQFGYDGIAADNFAVGNALDACGIWKDGQWIQKYTGTWEDPAYSIDALNWISTFYSKLKSIAPDVSFGINYSLNEMLPSDSRVLAVSNHLDYVLDEAGYTGWGFGKPTPERWDAISTWIENIQASGKHYFGINEVDVLDGASKEWSMACYLMSKNAHSSMVVTGVQTYGIETKMPEYDGLSVGSPVGARYWSQGLWWRQYSNGLVVVNVYNHSVTVTLQNNGFRYKDVYGSIYSSDAAFTIQGQTGIVMGVTVRPPTTTLSATTTTTATTTTITTTTNGGFSSTSSGSSTSTASSTTSSSPDLPSTPTPTPTPTPSSTSTSESESSASTSSVPITYPTTTGSDVPSSPTGNGSTSENVGSLDSVHTDTSGSDKHSVSILLSVAVIVVALVAMP